MPTRDFPPGILRILRNADSEAKRLGHSRVTPLHLAEAIRRKDDDEAFADKMARLTAQLTEQFAESTKLEGEIKKNLAGLGYGF